MRCASPVCASWRRVPCVSLSTPPDDELARFEGLLGRCERAGRRQLSFDELRSLGRMYRLHAAALARERHRGRDPEAVRHLNALCVRAHAALYSAVPPPQAALADRGRALLDALARTWRQQLAAWLLLFAGGGVGALVASRDPAAVPALVPAGLGHDEAGLEALVSSAEARARFLLREQKPAADNAVFGSLLFGHNLRVSIGAFAMGILAGVPTACLQLYNGIVLGSFSWIFLRDPSPYAFLAWILPHGVPELTAISLCVAGGLLLGEAVAAPGRRGRRQALREAQRPALLLLGLAVPLLALAAGMESFVRESTLGTATRLCIAAFEVALLLGGLAWLRRRALRRLEATPWLAELARGKDQAARSAR